MAPVRRLIAPTSSLPLAVSFAAVVSVASFAGAADRAPAAGDAVAVVDGVPITVGSLLEEMRRRRAGSGRPGETDARAAALEALVRDETVHAAARRAGYDKRPEVVHAIRLLVTGRYLEDELAPILAALKVGEDEVDARYHEREQEFTSPKMVRAALVKVAIPDKASAQKRAELRSRAEQARAEALALPPAQHTFGSVAVDYSDDQATRYRGGDIGLLPVGRPADHLEEAVLGALLALAKPGEISPVVEGRDGYYIVKLAEIREPRLRPLAEVREQLRQRILEEKKRTAEAQFHAALRARVKLAVDKDVLDHVTLPAAGDAGGPPALPGSR